jgi:hypothetical protein
LTTHTLEKQARSALLKLVTKLASFIILLSSPLKSIPHPHSILHDQPSKIIALRGSPRLPNKGWEERFRMTQQFHVEG